MGSPTSSGHETSVVKQRERGVQRQVEVRQGVGENLPYTNISRTKARVAGLVTSGMVVARDLESQTKVRRKLIFKWTSLYMSSVDEETLEAVSGHGPSRLGQCV